AKTTSRISRQQRKGGRRGRPFSLIAAGKCPPHPLGGTAHRKASRQKALRKILCATGGTMRGLMHLGGMILACAGCALATVPASAQGSYSQYDESATAALARYVRDLAADPKDFTSLIGAGRAALVLGDAEAAGGFFARADAANPNSPLPQAGMGGVSVLKNDPQAALPYFERAVQLGATLATIGCDRGLAYDLLGRQAEAQADYRAAMNGPDRDEARR